MSPSRGKPLPEADVIWEIDRPSGMGAGEPVAASRTRIKAIALVVVLMIAALTTWLVGDSTPPADSPAAAPGSANMRRVFDAVGGIDGLVLGRAEGAFDLVTFDPQDPSHLLASMRSSYGPAENQAVNEEWRVSNGTVSQELFAPDIAHDVAHFNNDGTVAVWSNSGNNTAFASRTVTLESGSRSAESEPVYASRSVIAGGALFALTGSEDYYSSNVKFERLIADRGGQLSVLDAGVAWSWVDSPTPGVVVAYPADDQNRTAVWNATSLERIPDHPLAGQPHRRIAVSGDGKVAVGVTSEGQLEVLDPATGRASARFGSLNPDGIAQPITLSHDGTVAITVDTTGTVILWWVGDSQPIVVIDADAGPARVLTERRAPRTSSAVDPTARRIAVRQTATAAMPTTWTIIDTDPASWLERVCRLGGGALTAEERSRLGLPSDGCR